MMQPVAVPNIKGVLSTFPWELSKRIYLSPKNANFSPSGESTPDYDILLSSSYNDTKIIIREWFLLKRFLSRPGEVDLTAFQQDAADEDNKRQVLARCLLYQEHGYFDMLSQAYLYYCGTNEAEKAIFALYCSLMVFTDSVNNPQLPTNGKDGNESLLLAAEALISNKSMSNAGKNGVVDTKTLSRWLYHSVTKDLKFATVMTTAITARAFASAAHSVHESFVIKPEALSIAKPPLVDLDAAVIGLSHSASVSPTEVSLKSAANKGTKRDRNEVESMELSSDSYDVQIKASIAPSSSSPLHVSRPAAKSLDLLADVSSSSSPNSEPSRSRRGGMAREISTELVLPEPVIENSKKKARSSAASVTATVSNVADQAAAKIIASLMSSGAGVPSVSAPAAATITPTVTTMVNSAFQPFPPATNTSAFPSGSLLPGGVNNNAVGQGSVYYPLMTNVTGIDGATMNFYSYLQNAAANSGGATTSAQLHHQQSSAAAGSLYQGLNLSNLGNQSNAMGVYNSAGTLTGIYHQNTSAGAQIGAGGNLSNLAMLQNSRGPGQPQIPGYPMPGYNLNSLAEAAKLNGKIGPPGAYPFATSMGGITTSPAQGGAFANGQFIPFPSAMSGIPPASTSAGAGRATKLNTSHMKGVSQLSGYGQHNPSVYGLYQPLGAMNTSVNRRQKKNRDKFKVTFQFTARQAEELYRTFGLVAEKHVGTPPVTSKSHGAAMPGSGVSVSIGAFSGSSNSTSSGVGSNMEGSGVVAVSPTTQVASVMKNAIATGNKKFQVGSMTAAASETVDSQLFLQTLIHPSATISTVEEPTAGGAAQFPSHQGQDLVFYSASVLVPLKGIDVLSNGRYRVQLNTFMAGKKKFSRNSTNLYEALWIFEIALLVSDAPVLLSELQRIGNYNCLAPLGYLGFFNSTLEYYVELGRYVLQFYDAVDFFQDDLMSIAVRNFDALRPPVGISPLQLSSQIKNKELERAALYTHNSLANALVLTQAEKYHNPTPTYPGRVGESGPGAAAAGGDNGRSTRAACRRVSNADELATPPSSAGGAPASLAVSNGQGDEGEESEGEGEEGSVTPVALKAVNDNEVPVTGLYDQDLSELPWLAGFYRGLSLKDQNFSVVFAARTSPLPRSIPVVCMVKEEKFTAAQISNAAAMLTSVGGHPLHAASSSVGAKMLNNLSHMGASGSSH